jgi:hypothetical protein
MENGYGLLDGWLRIEEDVRTGRVEGRRTEGVSEGRDG